MATELYDLTVPVFIRGLNALSGLLDKGAAFAAEKGIDPATLPERMANFDRANAGAHPPPTPRPPFKCIARAQIVYALLLL